MIAAKGQSGISERKNVAELPALFRGMGTPSRMLASAGEVDAAKGPQKTKADRNELARERKDEEERTGNARSAAGERAGTTNEFVQALLNETGKPH